MKSEVSALFAVYRPLSTVYWPSLSRNLCIFGQKAARLLSIIAQLVHFHVKGRDFR